ncbi:hypothetical protein [Tautonia rosea]|uniref:hypothetical protein n=1 Tax=Tautonia rosea TaxID=2728037 RepID=UPI001474FA72|nr:hypothetical protein [Tautonia rosea]
MNPSLWPALLSLMFFGTSLGIFLKQRRARSCPRHRTSAGLIAQTLAVACLVAGIILAGLAMGG